MKSLKFHLSIIILLFVTSCGDRGGSGSSGVVSVGGYDNECATISEYIKNVRVIPLDKRQPLSYVQKISVLDSSFVIAARNGLFVFDTQGGFVRNLTHKGRGPREWMVMCTFAIRDSLISIFDGASNKILYYTIKGEYAGKKTVPDMSLANLYDAEYVSENRIFGCNYLYGKDNGLFCLYDDAGIELARLLSTPVKTDGGAVNTGTHPFCYSGKDVFMILPRSNFVYKYEEGAVSPVYEIRTKQHVLSTKELASLKNFLPTSLDNSFMGFSAIFDTESYLVLDYYNLSTTFVDKKTRKALTISNSDSDFPIFPLYAQSGNKVYAVLSGFELEIFLNTQEPRRDSTYDNLRSGIRALANNGYDAFLIEYTVRR